MKLGIIGTRGIPNNHGGFEQFAEYFSIHMAERGHEVYVYNSHNHPYQDDMFHGVKIIHCYDPEYKIGTAGQFIYDLNCIWDARKRNFDVILQLGYTSSSIWHWLMPKSAKIVTNMDGLEWKRSKYSAKVRRFLKYAEGLAAENSDFLISDSIGIKDHLKKVYGLNSEYIAYGADVFVNPSKMVLDKYGLSPFEYNMLIARLEPENNIETIIKGYIKSQTKRPLLIFGGLNSYGKLLSEKYGHDERVRFVGPNYNQEELNNLRYYSRFYFHGHSVGGTNPSLLEAMSSNTFIIANDNIFNKAILEEEALYFRNSEDVKGYLDTDQFEVLNENFTLKNRYKIKQLYSWDIINNKYESFLLSIQKGGER
ncbi:DUF1972 domain-containing protein [Robertkochia flava]|uniref:DUF1972 domain-containing protein n=1 Tax=Robertkochia flava TaxID=3447986 RepID=UPI001CCA0CA9|nr:DUF1972 domain-containing protein [Robertkochia marina]